VQGGDNSTLRLDLDNDPQPDAFLRILPEFGGQSRTANGYVEGATELIAEVAASSASYDLHDKLNAYRRNGVREYVVWRVYDQAIDWFVLREGKYDRLSLTPEGLYQSEVFPGLWLDPAALLRGDLALVLQVVQRGLATPEHARFVNRLEADAAGRR
jgi:Uma2 family endonuclease